ncbi:MAG: class I SAM-dependent methyltransferase [Jhaorihella sp.]
MVMPECPVEKGASSDAQDTMMSRNWQDQGASVIEQATKAYLNVGLSGLRCITSALAGGINESPGSILDFGCGWGRVARWLKAAYPLAHIEGCDIDIGGIEFVASELDVKTWKSAIDPSELRPEISYDLIWVGSVITHLTEVDSTKLIEKLFSFLNKNGVLVLSTHGRHVQDAFDNGRYKGHPSEPYYAAAVAEYKATGYGYCSYKNQTNYGLSIIRPAWFFDWASKDRSRRVVSYIEKGWNQHHDVFAVQKVTPRRWS